MIWSACRPAARPIRLRRSAGPTALSAAARVPPPADSDAAWSRDRPSRPGWPGARCQIQWFKPEFKFRSGQCRLSVSRYTRLPVTVSPSRVRASPSARPAGPGETVTPGPSHGWQIMIIKVPSPPATVTARTPAVGGPGAGRRRLQYTYNLPVNREFLHLNAPADSDSE